MTISELNCGCACIAICDAGNFIFWLNISDPADRAFLNRAVSGPECAKDGQELFELCGRFGIHMGLIAGKTDLHEVSARSQCGGPHFFTCSFWVDPVSEENLRGLCLLGNRSPASDAEPFLALCREMSFPCGIIRDSREQ